MENDKIDKSEHVLEEDKFWNIISNSLIRSGGDYLQQQKELKEELLKLSPKDIYRFDNRFHFYHDQAYTWDLWAAAEIIGKGCSDDGFHDFRGWLIGKGKEVFFNALKDPETLISLDFKEGGNSAYWEGLSYIAYDVYEDKTDDEMPIAPDGVFSRDDIEGEEYPSTKSFLKNKYPKLWEKWIGD